MEKIGILYDRYWIVVCIHDVDRGPKTVHYLFVGVNLDPGLAKLVYLGEAKPTCI